VSNAKDHLLTYIYDATGRKLNQTVARGDTVKMSEYHGEFFYETDTMKFINHEEGRIVVKGTPEYQYHLKDHLGNVRMTFTTVPDHEIDTATLETSHLSEDAAKFLRVSSAKRVNAAIFDHTNDDAAGYSQRLNGSADEKFGLARSLSVMPGDTVKAEVYAKYVDPNSSNWTGALATLVGQIAANTSGVVYTGESYTSNTTLFPFPSTQSTTDNENAPKAYLNWLVFDRNFTFNADKSGYQQIGTSGKEAGSDVDHELLNSPAIAITEPGYVYIYLSNEETTPVEVYFDDFKVTHTKSPVVQSDDYYPFGLTFNSYSRENAAPQNFTYNGKEEQKDLGLGWLDYGARMYMPDIARWTTVDPWVTKYKNWSPYNYAFNNPVRYSDFMGMGPEDKKGPNGMSETQVFSRDEINDKTTITRVTQETRTTTTTENDDGTTTTTVSRSVTTNTITKNNETGETSVEHGKTNTATYSETTNSDGKVVNSSQSLKESASTSQGDKSMKNLNAWTNKISNFNSSHDKTFNQTIASQGRTAMTAAALAPTILVPVSGTQVLMGAGNRLLAVIPGPPVGAGILAGSAPGAVTGIMTDAAHSGGAYVHSVSQSKIKNGSSMLLMESRVLDR